MKSKIDEATFLAAYDELADSIFRLCYFRLYDREIAKDTTQEVFKKVWIQVSEGKKIKNLKAFIYQTARNAVVDQARKGKFRQHLPLDDLVESGRDPGDDGHLQIQARAEAEVLSKVIAQLEPEYKEVFLLRHVEQYSPKEIGKMLGVSANVVSVRLNRATKMIRSLI